MNGATLGSPPEGDWSVPSFPSEEVIHSSSDLTVRTVGREKLSAVSLAFPRQKVSAIIGPSGCGKTTYVRCLNRMAELAGLTVSGEVHYRGRNIYDARVDPVQVRRRIGMVFQRPTVFPSSIYENVAFGLRLERKPREDVEREVVRSLRRAGLWEEVREDLDRPALALSGGQQQRLCIARALAVEPGVRLLDVPTSRQDPHAPHRVEDQIYELQRDNTGVIVTHNMQQAARVADYTAFLYQGRLVEFEETRQLFESPREKLTENYITGRFG
jgi:phosphate transport system ATP-binding protein